MIFEVLEDRFGQTRASFFSPCAKLTQPAVALYVVLDKQPYLCSTVSVPKKGQAAPFITVL